MPTMQSKLFHHCVLLAQFLSLWAHSLVGMDLFKKRGLGRQQSDSQSLILGRIFMTRLQGDYANISGAQKLLEVKMLQAALPEYLLVIEKVTWLEYLQIFIPVLISVDTFFLAEVECWLLKINRSPHYLATEYSRKHLWMILDYLTMQ